LRAHFLSARSPQFRYSVKGTRGSYTKGGVDVQEHQLKEGVSVFDHAFGVEPEDIHGLLEILQPDSTVLKTRRVTYRLLFVGLPVHFYINRIPSEKGTFISLYRNLAAAIRDNAPLEVEWEEAASVIQIIELAKQSSSEGKTVGVPVVMHG
jgi:predicted dehydrogenase